MQLQSIGPIVQPGRDDSWHGPCLKICELAINSKINNYLMEIYYPAG